MAIRTQKAQGISLLASLANELKMNTRALTKISIAPQPFIILQPEVSSDGDGVPTISATESARLQEMLRIEMLNRSWKFPLFARPCPTTPRHGFVDSRRVHGFVDIIEVVSQTIAADPNGEVILMPVVSADMSAVITSSMIGVGPGNDGATAGVGSTNYTIATARPSQSQLVDARIDLGEDAYFEVVVDGKNARLVQMRGGPRLTGGIGNYVPRKITPAAVIKAEGDALEWEATMKKYADSSVVVVWHPGGWRGSHYAVHAILNRVAIVFDDIAPGRFVEIQPTDESAVAAYDADAITTGLARGLAADLSAFAQRESGSPDLLALAATCVHGAPSMRTGAAAEMMGAGLAVLLRLSVAACIGEYRHSKSSNLESERHVVYADTLGRFDSKMRARFTRAMTSFANEKWGASFGGAAWARCAMMTADLEDSIMAVLRNGDGKPDIDMVIARAHRLLNAAHNTGALLNKFGDPAILDYAAGGSRWQTFASVMFWHRNYIAPSTSRVVWMMREAFAMDEIAAKARTFWSSERGEFLQMDEAIERALLTKSGRRRKNPAIQVREVPEFFAQFSPAGYDTIVVQIARTNQSDRIVKASPRLTAPLPKNIYGTVNSEGRREQPGPRPYLKQFVAHHNPANVYERATLGTRRSFAGTGKPYKIAEATANGDHIEVYATLETPTGTERMLLLRVSKSLIPS